MAKVCPKSVNFAIAMSIHQLLALTPHQGPFETLKRIVLESRASQSKVIMIIATLVIMIRSWSSHIKYLQHDGKKTHTCNQCGFSSISVLSWKDTCRFIVERSISAAHSATTHAQQLLTSNYTYWHIRERSLSIAHIANTPAHKLFTSRTTWQPNQEKNLLVWLLLHTVW